MLTPSNCDLFYISPSHHVINGVLGPLPELKTPPPVHLPNTLVPKVDWDPRTLEGILTLVCPYPQAKEELFAIKDFGSLVITYAETGAIGIFDEDMDVLLTFYNIIREKYYLRDLIGGKSGHREAMSLDVSGRVTLG